MAEPPASPPRAEPPPPAQAPAPGAPPPAARKTFLAPAQLPSRLTYVAVAGPSGVKQCFRSVKTVRRIPTLPKKIPKDSDSDPSVVPEAAAGASSAPGSSSAGAGPSAEPTVAKRSRKERPSDWSKRHACGTCDKRFTSPGKLSQHLLSHTGELPFTCEFCDKRFNSKFKLVRHGLIHTETRAFSCPVCAKTFNRKDHLNNHIRVHNPVKKVYRCERPGCRKQYTSLLSFRKHMALHSAEEGNLQCKICSKTFQDRADIVYHLKVHTGSRTVKNETDKKFNCSFCDRKFFTGKDVRRHLVVHTGRRDFLCQFCPQKFGRKDHLVRHMKNAHPDEAWSSAAAGTSSAPDLIHEESYKTEEVLDENITYIDFPLSSEQIEAYLKEESSEPGPSGEQEARTPVPESNIIIEDPMDPVKEEPSLDIVKHEPYELELKSPVPSTSRDVMPGSLAESIEYPNVLYILPTSPPYPPSRDLEFSDDNLSVAGELPELGPGHLIDAAEVESILSEGNETLSSEIIDLIQSGRILSQEQPTVLPTFTQAFQSSSGSPKPPQPPPPPQ